MNKIPLLTSYEHRAQQLVYILTDVLFMSGTRVSCWAHGTRSEDISSCLFDPYKEGGIAQVSFPYPIRRVPLSCANMWSVRLISLTPLPLVREFRRAD